MSEMTPGRFAEILAAYGAEPRRWPDAERGAAQAFLRMAPGAAARLEAAADVDDLLLLSRAPLPSAVLRGHVLSAAPRRSVRGRALLWWAGFAMAGAAVAGALTGTAAAAAFEPIALPGYGHAEATVFGAIEEPEE